MSVNNETKIGKITPTVYIDTITLESVLAGNSYTDGLRVTLNLIIKDKLDSKFNSTWFSNSGLTDFIKIRVIQSYRSAFLSDIQKSDIQFPQ